MIGDARVVVAMMSILIHILRGLVVVLIVRWCIILNINLQTAPDQPHLRPLNRNAPATQASTRRVRGYLINVMTVMVCADNV